MMTRNKKKLKEKKRKSLTSIKTMNNPTRIIEEDNDDEVEIVEDYQEIIEENDYTSFYLGSYLPCEWCTIFEDEIVFVSKTCTFVFRSTSIYILWILLHYTAAHLYANWCAPVGWIGFISSPFLVASPQCKALRWIIYNGGNAIDFMWISLGVWLVSKLHM
jgi:hypothetical protein